MFISEKGSRRIHSFTKTSEKVTALLLALLIFASAAIPAAAENDSPILRQSDAAELVSAKNEGELTAQFSELIQNIVDLYSFIATDLVASTIGSIPMGMGLIQASKVKTISEKKAPDDLWLTEDGAPTEYIKKIHGNASAYSGYGLTATGTTTEQGSIAVNPKIIPYGSKLWIISDDGRYVYGYSVAEDTGGFIYWNKAPIADLFMYSEDECETFGRRDITIYVLSTPSKKK